MSNGGNEQAATLADVHLAWIREARSEFESARGRASSAPRPFSTDAGAESLRDLLVQSLTNYGLGETISAGGQGVVIKAFQRSTRREVAIKVLRSGHLASQAQRVRFEREVQILAQLRHANIVTIHDSGAAGGLLYFVMDYIRGQPLDEYMERARLPVRARLKLFARICDAINVAHLRGITHRDLKPGNIRVDPSGEPHILDFGLAKVDEHDVLAPRESAMPTMTGQFVGSLPWAAPEQLSGKPGDIDLRTDVYALGVLLYQLLTGRFPYDVSGTFSDAMQRILHEDPKRPSKQGGRLDDDVDQIVLKCLRKEADNRYQAAGEIAREIRRYLAGEPIEAKRDSGWYMLRKTIRRHRVTAAISGLVLAVIVTAAISYAVLYRQQRDSTEREHGLRVAAETAEKLANEARQQAERFARIKADVNHFFSGEVLAAAAPDRLGPNATITQALDVAGQGLDGQFGEDPIVAGEIHFILGMTYFRQGRNEDAERHMTRAIALFDDAVGVDHESTVRVRASLGRVYENMGRFEEAARLTREALEKHRAHFGDESADVFGLESNLGWIYARMGRWKEAEERTAHALAGLRRTAGEEHADTLNAMNNLGLIYLETDRPKEAEPLLRVELAASRKTLGDDDPGTLVSMGNLSQLYARLGQMEDATRLAEECLSRRKRVLGEGHPSTLLLMNNLGALYQRRQMAEQAIATFEEAFKAGRGSIGSDHPTVISITSNLAATYDRGGRHSDAEPLHREALERGKGYLPEGHAYIGLYQSRLGRCLAKLDQREEAEALLREGYAILAMSPAEASNRRETAAALAELLEASSRAEEAKEWKEKAEDAS